MLDLIGSTGRVITIDIKEGDGRPEHTRIEYFLGSSVEPRTIEHVELAVRQTNGSIMVTLDSLHNRNHVAAELAAYHRFVSPGSYLIVEDSEINGHPVYYRGRQRAEQGSRTV
jgi:cephalosporin hydroxylase